MEQFEDPSQNTNDQKKKNTMWTQEMDKCLIEALVLQCNEGNKIDKGFKEVAYTAAANILNKGNFFFFFCRNYVTSSLMIFY